MELTFKQILGVKKGKEAYVIAHGPSVNPFLDRIPELAEKGVLIGCNEWYPIYDTPPQYWVLANNVMRVETELDRMNKLAGKTTVVYADTVDLTDKGWINANLKADWIAYDQRHLNRTPCPGGNKPCCRYFNKDRVTIQEELQEYSGHTKIYGGGDTVVLHCITLAIILGCNPINVLGMDLDYRKGYARNSNNLLSKVQVDTFDDTRDRIMEHLRIVVESAKRRGTRVQSPNSENLWGILEHGDI